MIEEKTVYWGHDIKGAGNVKVKNQQACASLAATKEGALFWTYRPSDNKCFIKSSKKGKRAHVGRVSGSVGCAQGKHPARKPPKVITFRICKPSSQAPRCAS